MILDVGDVGSTPLEADVCIVGGGVAGLTLAAALADSALNVILLEAGGYRQTAMAEDLNRGELANPDNHPWPHHYRVRALGGASRIWGGGCVPLDDIDFEERPWAPGPGWPFSYEALRPYYLRAQEAAEAGPFRYTAPSPLAPALEPGQFQTILERFSRPTNFGKRWRAILAKAANVRVMLNASAVAVRLKPGGGQVDHIEIAAPDGRRLKITARNYVLAAGGLEVPRLLLASNDVRPKGVGNDHDWVGRSYMCHLAAIGGIVSFTGPPDSIASSYERDSAGIYFRRRLLLSPDAQRRHRILNIAFRLQPADPADPSHGDPVLSALHIYRNFAQSEYSIRYREQTRANKDQMTRHLGNIVSHPIQFAAFARKYLSDRLFASRKLPSISPQSSAGRYALEFHAEQAANPDSRVTLGDTTDRFGMRRMKIDWRAMPIDIETVMKAYGLLREELTRTGAGQLDADEDQLIDQINTAGAYGGHHIGATRMAVDPQDGVVDADCKVHGVDNLFVASASVMPTSGQANPTLTILALAYRLADHLQHRSYAAPEPSAPQATLLRTAP